MGQARQTSSAVTKLPSWQAAVRDAVRDPAELAKLLELPADVFDPIGERDFPLLVPRGFIARMRKRDLADPLLKQILPRRIEHADVSGFSNDPLQERGIAAHGVLRKYPQRALLIASGACPVHCRYCFRRAFPYQEQLAARADWDEALDALARVDDVSEVILSGGDPLSLSNQRLGRLLAKLEATAVQTVRIHTRFPIVVPERVDEGLLAVLRETRLHTVVVVHCNHANELDERVEVALQALRAVVGFVLNQSVLLREVNDEIGALRDLSRRLFACGVLPYYLHLLDPIAGAAHFNVDEERGRVLIAALRALLPGYLVPRLVKETPGELSKTLIA
ncbi:MAG TPA: EF-P beta-lysylation protein EpmB [Gammaproteobacteria bacterium]|nr:EF-P beta-lysylation protein EpmB [Gammaproteobacteria bacterium]